MVAHFCYLNYGATNLLFYGPFLAKLWHWQTSANLDQFRFVMAQNVRAEENIKKIIIIFCHIVHIPILHFGFKTMGYKMCIPYNSRLCPKPFVDKPGLYIELFRLIRLAQSWLEDSGCDSGWTGWPGRWDKPPQHRGRGWGVWGGGLLIFCSKTS